jgi:hypothetical protein
MPYSNYNNDVYLTRLVLFERECRTYRLNVALPTDYRSDIYHSSSFEQIQLLNTKYTSNFPCEHMQLVRHLTIWITPGFRWRDADDWLQSLKSLPHLETLTLVNAARERRTLEPLKRVKWNEFPRLATLQLELFPLIPSFWKQLHALPLASSSCHTVRVHRWGVFATSDKHSSLANSKRSYDIEMYDERCAMPLSRPLRLCYKQ